MVGGLPHHSMTLFNWSTSDVRAIDGFGKPSGSGEGELIAGTLEHGYYGEVSASEFINGNDLAVQVGLTAGGAFNSDAGWLKFSLDYKTLYVAKKPFRYSISWNQLNSVGIVSGTTTVTINGKLYKVRLLKGRGDGLNTTISYGNDTLPTHNSEWNRLMYHVAASINGTNISSEGIVSGDWAQFSNADLGLNGLSSLCQEVITGNTNIVARGSQGAGIIEQINRTSVYTFVGWRPCLELVE